MRERGAVLDDVQRALTSATRCSAADKGRWKLTGRDRDGDELTVVIALEDGVVVVTVF